MIFYIFGDTSLILFEMNFNPHHFSQETINFLGHWLSGGKDVEFVSENSIKELNKYKPNIEIKLYRGVKNDDKIDKKEISFSFYSSWAYDEKMALNFSDNGDIISIKVGSDKILVDTTLLNPKFIISRCSGFPEETEVILLPGKYKLV